MFELRSSERGYSPMPMPTRIMLVGGTGTGKTTFINVASGGNFSIGNGLQSCTRDVAEAPPFLIGDREVILVDTPGLDDTTRSDAEILSVIANYLLKLHTEHTTLSGIAYLHRITDVRMSGSSARSLKLFMKLCGNKQLRNVIIVTTRWGMVDLATAERRESQLRNLFFNGVLSRGAMLARHANAREEALNILRQSLTIAMESPLLPLQIQVEMGDQRKKFMDTGAGRELLAEQVDKYNRELWDIEKDLQDAIRDNDFTAIDELSRERARIKEKLGEIVPGQEDQDIGSTSREGLSISSPSTPNDPVQAGVVNAITLSSSSSLASLKKARYSTLDVQTEDEPAAFVRDEAKTRGPMARSLLEQPAQLLDTKDDIGDVFDPSDIVIAVMGTAGSGKTTFINTASAGRLLIGDGLQLSSTSIETSPSFFIDGRNVVLVDTPGFDDTTKTDMDTLSMISVFLAEMYKGNKKLAGIIYLHRISDVRVGGASARSFRIFRKLCGEASLKNVVIATTKWSEVPFEVAEARERELMEKDLFFKPVLDRGAKMVRYDNTAHSAHALIRSMVRNEPLPLLIQTEVVDDNKNLAQTAAGAEIMDDIETLISRHEREIRGIREEMREAIREREIDVQEEAARMIRQMLQDLARFREDREKLREAFTTQRNRYLQREKDDVQAAHDKVEELSRMVRDQKRRTPIVEREALQHQLAEAKQRLQQLEARGKKQRGCVTM
ncbi:hypothetical protein L218DRAFT_963229 [Marasmius fiardii PR-910]|nr:hypothetical protein L218DRAFT_963229 [Marasmius fiardii PR-910]